MFFIGVRCAALWSCSHVLCPRNLVVEAKVFPQAACRGWGPVLVGTILAHHTIVFFIPPDVFPDCGPFILKWNPSGIWIIFFHRIFKPGQVSSSAHNCALLSDEHLHNKKNLNSVLKGEIKKIGSVLGVNKCMVKCIHLQHARPCIIFIRVNSVGHCLWTAKWPRAKIYMNSKICISLKK